MDSLSPSAGAVVFAAGFVRPTTRGLSWPPDVDLVVSEASESAVVVGAIFS